MANDKVTNDKAGSALDKKLTKGLQGAKDALAEKMVQLAHKDAEATPQETVYNVVFTGTFTKDEKMVVAAMAKFFKQGQEATRRLLKAGRVVKTFDDKGPADKLAKMLNGIGLSCKVEMEVTGGEKNPTLLEKAAFKVADADVPAVHLPKVSQFTWKVWVAVAVVLAALVGGGYWWWKQPPVVKGNSFASYEASVKKVVDYASAEKKDQLKKAIDLMTGAGMAYHERNTFGGSEEVAANMAYGRISGMTGDEIIAASSTILENKRSLFRKEIEDTRKQIDEEKATIAELEPNNEELKKLEIADAHYTWSQGESPRLTFKLVNNGTDTMSRVYFQGYLYNAQGKLLVTKDFTFTTGLGIRPGSYKYVDIGTETGGPWAIDEGRSGWSSMTLKVTIEKAENMAGKSIGVDLRPNYKRIAEAEKHIAEMEKQLAAIVL